MLFFAGRFIGTLLMSKFRPADAAGHVRRGRRGAVLDRGFAGGDIGLYALMATSFFMSIQFPTIFTMSLRGLGPYTKSGSSFLVMAIVGGAVDSAAHGAGFRCELHQHGHAGAGGCASPWCGCSAGSRARDGRGA